MKYLPLVSVLICLLFVIYLGFISGYVYPILPYELFVLKLNVEWNFLIFDLMPFIPLLLLIVNLILKIKTKFLILTITLILIDFYLFNTCWLRPY